MAGGIDMRTRRLTGLGLGMMATVALGVAGCTADNATPGASASAETPSAPASSGAADPAAASALASATAALGTTSFKVTLTSGPGVKLTGFVDAPGNKGTGTLAITGPNANIQVKTLLVDQDLYVQVPGITKAGTWTHVDVARLPEGANVGLRPGQIDPANTAKVLTSTTDVQQVDSRSYKGTLDLTKVAGITGVDKVTVDGLGAAAQNVPFTAGLDDQGRLSALTIQLPAANGKQSPPVEVLYTDYGTPVTAERPAATAITEAPDNLYTSLGG
jgi:LppX_LprAFG lipoprotein